MSEAVTFDPANPAHKTIAAWWSAGRYTWERNARLYALIHGEAVALRADGSAITFWRQMDKIRKRTSWRINIAHQATWGEFPDLEYDVATAEAAGYLARCDARLMRVIGSPGEYRCLRGHWHAVTGSIGAWVISPLGLSAAFALALGVAGTMGRLAGQAGEPAYQAAWNAEMQARGFACVCRSKETA